MPTKPPSFKPNWLGNTETKPFANSRTAALRITGRALQVRNKRIQIRDGYICQVCGRMTTQGEVDHRTPLSQGGSEDDSNLQWLCRAPCHAEKSKAEAGVGRKSQG